MTDLVLDSVSIDGKSLRDIVGDQLIMRSRVMQAAPDTISISWSGPSPEELEDMVKGWAEDLEKIADGTANELVDLQDKYDELRWEREDIVANFTEKVVNGTLADAGDFVKTSLTEVQVTDANGQPVSFAHKKAAQESDYSGVITGVSAGVITMLAAATMVAVCNRQRKTEDHYESLL